MHHRPAHEPGIAQEVVRLGDAPGGELFADQPGGDAPPGDLDRRHDVDGKAAPRRFGGKQVRGAGAILAEPEVEADRGPTNAKPVQQDVVDEVRGRRSASAASNFSTSPGKAACRNASFARWSVRRNSGSCGRRSCADAPKGQPRPAAERLRARARERSRPGGPRWTRRNCRWQRPRLWSAGTARRHDGKREGFKASGHRAVNRIFNGLC
jgi:hypothetical protein